MKHYTTILLTALCATCALAAGPATKPADIVTVQNAANHFSFAVPRAWKATKNSPRQHVFELPGDAASSTGGIFVVQIGTPKDNNAVLADIVDAKKKQLTDKSDKVKFLADKEDQLDGMPAWRLEYLLPVAAKETTRVNGKAGEAKDVTLMNHSVEIMGMKDHVVYDMVFVGIDADSVARLKQVEAVLASFRWAK